MWDIQCPLRLNLTWKLAYDGKVSWALGTIRAADPVIETLQELQKRQADASQTALTKRGQAMPHIE